MARALQRPGTNSPSPRHARPLTDCALTIRPPSSLRLRPETSEPLPALIARPRRGWRQRFCSAAETTQQLHDLSTPEAVKGTVHALATWILAFSHNGEGYGFPFDLPYLTLYERILTKFCARPVRTGA